MTVSSGGAVAVRRTVWPSVDCEWEFYSPEERQRCRENCLRLAVCNVDCGTLCGTRERADQRAGGVSDKQADIPLFEVN